MSEKLIDFHAHILPRADHGSASVETSLKQISLLKSAGVKTVVATPHFYPEKMSVKEFISVRNACADDLLASLKDDSVKITLGAEVLVCEEMETMSDVEKLVIEGTDCLLLEMPFTERSIGIFDAIDNLSKKFMIVLAHIDRYPLGEVLNILECDNVYAQFNAKALTPFFKNRNYMGLIDFDKVVAIGSDIHGSDEKYAHQLKKAIARIGNERYERIMSHSADILRDAKYIN